jgi:hypothetical protein
VTATLRGNLFRLAYSGRVVDYHRCGTNWRPPTVAKELKLFEFCQEIFEAWVIA